jgi:hypothetical protein
MAKKQSKADKAFIEKIGTLGIKTSSGKKACPDCGHEMKQVGYLAGEVNGNPVGGPIYGHPGGLHEPGKRAQTERPVEATHEQSFSA